MKLFITRHPMHQAEKLRRALGDDWLVILVGSYAHIGIEYDEVISHERQLNRDEGDWFRAIEHHLMLRHPGKHIVYI